MFGKQESDVLVVGAGPVGLCSALFLADAGVQVQVIEEQWRGASRSYGLALHPSSLRLFKELGMVDLLLDRGNRVETLSVRDIKSERKQVKLSEISEDFPFVLVLPQQALEDVLRKELTRKGVKILWNHRLASFEMGPERVAARVERLAKESTGYSVSRTEWVVDKTYDWNTQFIIGADGHRSSVRRILGIDFAEMGNPSVFAVFEFDTEAAAGSELQIVLQENTTSVLWPMKEGRFRWSFELKELDEETDARVKSRLFVQIRDESYPYVEEKRLRSMIEQRASWFTPDIKEIFWSAAVRFERRLASQFGRGRAWLVGDSAHLALPIGIQSMNVGFREAKDLTGRIASLVRGRGALEELSEYDKNRRQEWEKLLGLSEEVQLRSSDSWLNDNVSRIVQSIPASGNDLEKILKLL